MARNKARKWGQREEFDQYTRGVPDESLAKAYRVSLRTMRDWRSGERPIPWWVCEVAHHRHEASVAYRRQIELRRLEERAERRVERQQRRLATDQLRAA